ncbi:MAG: NAD(P)H-dependent oxidoreductase [Proteobacteria bacterium]|nr:NAD(P)H-dependent oxidoreductase [Pseudomonadota bacterium]
MNTRLTALALNCSLKSDRGQASSTDLMISAIANELAKHEVDLVETLRLASYNILPGVSSDEGEGDDWPDIRRRILEADILIFGTPIWLGHLSSIAQRVLERMDAFLGEADDRGRYPSFSKVAVAAIVGNEDGAHAVTAALFQGLNDEGWTIPAASACYWVGEAMQSTDLKDLDKVPDKVIQTAKILASNTAHLARLLKAKPYPGEESDHGKQV